MSREGITVLLPVRNGGRWLAAALSSLAAQTRQADEILIVDDGSTDDSLDIVDRSGLRGLRVVPGPEAGLAAALEVGVHEARGQLIARMDADDKCHPRRLEVQARFLAQHAGMAMCGTWAYVERPRQPRRRFKVPVTMPGIRRYLCLGNPFVHSSVMFQRDAVLAAGSYRAPGPEPYPEDYDLWSRLARRSILGNVGHPLVTYREHGSGEATVGRATIGAAAVSIAADNLLLVTGRPASEADLAVLRAFHRVPRDSDRISLGDVRGLLLRIESGPAGKRGGEPSDIPLTTRLRLSLAALDPRH